MVRFKIFFMFGESSVQSTIFWREIFTLLYFQSIVLISKRTKYKKIADMGWQQRQNCHSAQVDLSDYGVGHNGGNRDQD
jgi:hypothetical protein